MLFLLTAGCLSSARAASLDNLEVGGFSGSPLATDGTASWWNPAGIAAGSGWRLTFEAAPIFGRVLYDRAEPNGGLDTYSMKGVLPFVGVATDAGLAGLGVGASLAVPIARGGSEEGFIDSGPDYGTAGTGSYTLRDGSIRAIQATAGLAWNFQQKLAIGLSGAMVQNQWTAVVDNDAMPDLDTQITAQGEVSGYTTDDLETERYKATLNFDGLQDTVYTFGAGVRVTPVPTVSLAVAFLKGVNVVNEGDLLITFQCPPDSDSIGRFGAEQFGICNTTIPASASVSYSLPSRVHGGVGWEVTPELHVEAIAGWVGWSVFDNYVIDIHDPQSDNESANQLLAQGRLWARDNRNSYWFGASGHGTLADRLTLGGKILYDESAIPDESLSPNNYDADAILVSGLLSFKPIDAVSVSVSYTHHFLSTREITTSKFGMSLPKPDLTVPSTDRYYYPNANGTYTGAINRVGVALQIALGGRDEARPEE
ncbi:MAG: hypothetical protein EXR69_10840 [Myxococcales bacterium]|nr:hypothetical protein [Myxococcales bacterium]